MSNWLGFSLTPHLRIDEAGFSSLMPLRSDDSLCVVDPFRRTSNADEGFFFSSSFASLIILLIYYTTLNEFAPCMFFF